MVKDEEDASYYAFESAKITVADTQMHIAIEYSDNCQYSDLKSGSFSVAYEYYEESVEIRYLNVGDEDQDYDMVRYMSWRNDEGGQITFKGNVRFYSDVADYKADHQYSFTVKFAKSNSPSVKPNPDNPDNPDKPGDNTPSKFNAILSGYGNAGYNVNLKNGNVDPTMASLINTLRQAYSQLGYGMEFIGKNLDNLLSCELYMLIETDSESTAKELYDSIKASYKCEKKGRAVIAYIWTLGTPNFEPFRQATN